MNIALILSGGTGTRLGASIPKQYLEVNGKKIISYSIEAMLKHPKIDAVQIVASDEWRDAIKIEIDGLENSDKFRGFSEPGENRQLSILSGIESCKSYAAADDIILVHDAARPNVSEELITRILTGAEQHDGAMPVLPMKDTVYFSEDGKAVSELLQREKIFAGQAPEAFKLGKYFDANRALLPHKILAINGATEPAVMAGMDIVMVEGDENNYKVTTMADLERLRAGYK
ncbi:2-C-methyl-D-erythritol 4-phosphate cytidylyltransferase [Lachnospiraceae bacterium]|nr:2-C-methyl-D-erythritol 4-phosphate cytidylyltransferase [Lachnospiraceae bacterium]